jgi:hypothetical protein
MHEERLLMARCPSWCQSPNSSLRHPQLSSTGSSAMMILLEPSVKPSGNDTKPLLAWTITASVWSVGMISSLPERT